MARPLKQGLDYFPHDTDACNDDKIEIMRALFGNDGYAFYFILLERIYRTGTASLDLSNKDTLITIKKRIGVRQNKFNKMLEKSLEIQLFDRELFEKNSVLTSPAISQRHGIVIENRNRMREKRGLLGVSSTQTTEQTTAQTGESKLKETKLNKENIKENNDDDNLQSLKKEVESLIFKTVEENFQPLTEIVKEQILDTIDEYGHEKVLWALKESVSQNHRNLAYASKILENDRARISKPNLPRGQLHKGLETDPQKYFKDKYSQHFTR